MKDLSDPAQSRKFLPDILPILRPALQIGSLCGVPGLLFGATVGVLRSKPPGILAIATGIQWFMLGGTFSASRDLVLQVRLKGEGGHIPPRDKMLASSVAGGVAGSTAGALRGLRSAVPGGILFAMLGAAGQKWYCITDARKGDAALQNSSSNGGRKWLDSKWSPLKVLSDVEYEKMLQERLLRIDTEIAMVDDSIEYEREIDERSRANQPDANRGNT